MKKDEPFIVPNIKENVGWRMNEQDMKNMRLLMADKRQKNISQLLRELVAAEAAITRKRWTLNAKHIAGLEESHG